MALGFAIGAFVGGVFGVIMMALVNMARDIDEKQKDDRGVDADEWDDSK